MGGRAISNYSMWGLFWNGRTTFVSLLSGEGAAI